MTDVIQLLPDSVANQIAAGEVIQRPASVIKELVENAVDAGATTINVLVIDAGRTSIQVVDNGCGMSDTDARLSFERHATSKIRQAKDLFALHTMGFRGEALASIAAVAEVELKTRREIDEVGTQLSISASKVLSQEPCACPVGSNFMVNNLFFNVPARRKFLKSNTTELNNILSAFERIALVYPQIAFTFHSNGAELYNLRPANTHQRIVDIFGKKLNQELLDLNAETTICNIKGFVGKPESARKKTNHQFFFVNGRYMRHAYFHKAVMSAFERLVPTGEQVPYFIYFDVDPENIDVNIHPTKTEIKFENEQAIWQILSAAVRQAIGVYHDVPALDFNNDPQIDIPTFDTNINAKTPKINYNPQYNPFKTPANTTPRNWQSLYPTPNQDVQQEGSIFDMELTNATEESDITDVSPIHYQYKATYIMTAVKSGLMIIDQHRAHVRILYEQYLQTLRTQQGTPQKVLFPEVIQLPVAENIALKKILPEMAHMGFELTDLGQGSYAINATPANLEGLNITLLVNNMIASALEQGNSTKDDIDKTLAATLANNAAIPQGQVLTSDEMENIVNSLFACENVNYTPNGKKIIAILKQQEIERLFG